VHGVPGRVAPGGAHPQDADEVGAQRGAGGRAGATELLAQVERDDPCRALLVEVVREVGQRHFAGQPRADRVGRLAVLEELRILRPSVDGRLVAGRRGRGYVSSLKSDPSSDGPTGASRSASRLLRSWPCRIHSRSTAINRSNLILPVLGKGRLRIFSFLLRFRATTGIPTCYPAEADCQQQIGPVYRAL